MNIIRNYRALKEWIKRTKYGQKYIQFKDEMQNQKLNRELIGIDKDGNKYYQYYSPWGLPTRREIDFANKNSYEMTDLAYYFWLTKREELPPTKEQVQQYYIEEKERKRRAIEWDEKERRIMLEFYQQRFKIIDKMEVNRRLGIEEEESERKLRLELENQKQIEEQKLNNLKNNALNQSQEGFEPEQWKPSQSKRPKSNAQ